MRIFSLYSTRPWICGDASFKDKAICVSCCQHFVTLKLQTAVTVGFAWMLPAFASLLICLYVSVKDDFKSKEKTIYLKLDTIHISILLKSLNFLNYSLLLETI